MFISIWCCWVTVVFEIIVLVLASLLETKKMGAFLSPMWTLLQTLKAFFFFVDNLIVKHWYFEPQMFFKKNIRNCQLAPQLLTPSFYFFNITYDMIYDIFLLCKSLFLKLKNHNNKESGKVFEIKDLGWHIAVLPSQK